MELSDSHCHLQLLDISAYPNGLEDVFSAARTHEVTYFLSVCVSPQSLPQLILIAHQYPQVYASVGVHPTEIMECELSTTDLIALAQDEKVVAIGETGLDYYHHKEPQQRALQHLRFRTHIQAALELKKPLIIHSRDAPEDTIRILKEEGAAKVGGVMHCFTESLSMAEAAMALGFYISFSGIVTFNNAKVLQEIAQKIPLSHLMIETDCPYLAPVPFRGKQNQPAYVRYVAEKIATLHNVPLVTVAEHTTHNFRRLFLNK